MTLANPFNFELPATRWSFTDREELLPRLERMMKGRGQRALLHGRRRMGKTSLLHHAAHQANVLWLFVDLSTAADLNEVAKKLLHLVPGPEERVAAKLLRIVQKYVKLSVRAGKFVLGELREPNEGADLETLEQVLDFINERAALNDTAVAIAFDEFQDIRVLGGARAEWKLRGIMQRHAHVNYFFSGSNHQILQWMTEPKAAFYKQLETIPVGPIPDTAMSLSPT